MNNTGNMLKSAFYLTEKGKYSEALDVVNDVISERPEWFQGYHEKAKVYARQKLWGYAIELIGEAIRLNEREPMLYFSRARWLIQSRLFIEAIDDLSRLIELEEELNDTYYLEAAFFFRALASSYLGRQKDVLVDCQKVQDGYSTYILGKPHSKDGLVSGAVNGDDESRPGG